MELGRQMKAQRCYGREWESATTLFLLGLKLLLFCERGESLSFKLSIRYGQSVYRVCASVGDVREIGIR